MPISETRSSAIADGARRLAVSQFFTVSSASNPAYLVVNGLDRNDYTAAANGDAGAFVGNGHTLALSAVDGDERGAGIVFTWQGTTGQYVNATYGSLSQLSYMASDSAHDVTSISLFATSSALTAQAYAGDAYALMQADPSGYGGSATIVTDPAYAGKAQTAATPDSIAAVAKSFVGNAWNTDGCWVLASTIAAEAGAALPVQSAAVDIAGKPNGEWYVAYDGPAGSSGAWQSLVGTGDIVDFVPAGGGGHITTCVSGSGSSAMLVDNIVYETNSGQIANPANDSSPHDILIAAPHAASQEFAGVDASSVVIYALDTPVVSIAKTAIAGAHTAVGVPLALAGLAGATDPEGGAITQYQLYDSAAGAGFVVNGVRHTAAGANTAITVTSLASVSLLATQAGTSVVDMRASNGIYWGDWQGLTAKTAAAVTHSLAIADWNFAAPAQAALAETPTVVAWTAPSMLADLAATVVPGLFPYHA